MLGTNHLPVALHQPHVVEEETPFAAVAGEHEGTAVIVDPVCALALAVAVDFLFLVVVLAMTMLRFGPQLIIEYWSQYHDNACRTMSAARIRP